MVLKTKQSLTLDSYLFLCLCEGAGFRGQRDWIPCSYSNCEALLIGMVESTFISTVHALKLLTRSHFVAQAGFELEILQCQPPKCWYFKNALPHLACTFQIVGVF